MPQISVIVPVYKVEPYLRRCVDSILAQTFTDFELILVDDGSPDNCGAICDEYAAKDPRVVVIHQENGGLSAARNAGIDAAQGDFICFVDSDDFIAPDYCRILLEGIQNKQCGFCACKVRRFSDGDEIDTTSTEMGALRTLAWPDFLRMQMMQQMEMGVWNRIYRRSLFDTIRFVHGRLHEDIIFAADMLGVIHGAVAYVDACLYYYRQRANSIVNTQVAENKCSPDRVFAGRYLVERAKEHRFEYLDDCLRYAAGHPWFFVDPIYVRGSFGENKIFLDALQQLIQENRESYAHLQSFSEVQRKRMVLFSYSKLLYAMNAYARLLRVYLFRLLGRDPYSDGHGI